MRFLCLLLLLGSLLRGADYDLWVLAGQSNAQGWKGDARHYPDDPAETDPSVPLFYHSPGIGSSGGGWVTLGPQHGIYQDGHFGPEVAFARRLAAAGKHPAIFKFTLGGSSLDRRWKGPGDGGLYDEMVAELARARRALETDGHRVRLAGLVWIQGESDATEPAAAARYAENLERLVKHFRTRVARDPRLPVLLGVDEQHPMVEKRPIIPVTQKQLAERDPTITFVPMLDLPKADKSHLTPKGLVEHGRRLAEAAIKLSQRAR